jgi:uncharacterized membrane protein YdfJ with MMPL/SSD domain
MIKQKNVILAQNQKSKSSHQNVYGHQQNLLSKNNNNPHMISGFTSKMDDSLNQSEDLLQNTFDLDISSNQDLNKDERISNNLEKL